MRDHDRIRPASLTKLYVDDTLAPFFKLCKIVAKDVSKFITLKANRRVATTLWGTYRMRSEGIKENLHDSKASKTNLRGGIEDEAMHGLDLNIEGDLLRSFAATNGKGYRCWFASHKGILFSLL